MTDLVLLWHMHQPRYVHPVTGRAALPWVRLHAASSYLDMARMLERHPNVRLTVNFVPSLVEQLEALSEGASDDLEVTARKPTDSLDESERQMVLERCFSVRWHREIGPRPRYAELFAARGESFDTPALRDLQSLFLLAWLGFASKNDDPNLGELDAKGRGFSEDDKAYLVGAVRRAASSVLPAWRKLARAGSIELSTSPFYHPIVPLLIDSQVARRARPHDDLPPRFAHAEDAREQIVRATALHERVFGIRAAGMWPPEGALSPEAVQLYRECGVSWLCGDEGTLARSTHESPPVHDRAKYRLWRHAGVHLLFRDRELSDRVGFRYSDLPAIDAVSDLVGAVRGRGGEGVVGIVLDGENAWESFPGRGEEFLDRLYGALENKSERVRTMTMTDAVRTHGPGTELARLHSGSWIDAAFRIWIGDPEKNVAWSRLLRARTHLDERARGLGWDDPRVRAAREHLLICEGSDWFWWFGEPFSSAEDSVFDSLFRAHLERSWRVLGDEPPMELAEPIGTRPSSSFSLTPSTLINPQLDGRSERYFEWQGAARYEPGRGGTMATHIRLLERVHVGFDAERLYIRLDPVVEERRRVTASLLRLGLRTEEGDRQVAIRLGAADGGRELRSLGGRVAALDVVEMSVPFAAIDAKPRSAVRLWFTLELAGITLTRVPHDGSLTLQVPWSGWEDEHWAV